MGEVPRVVGGWCCATMMFCWAGTVARGGKRDTESAVEVEIEREMGSACFGLAWIRDWRRRRGGERAELGQ